MRTCGEEKTFPRQKFQGKLRGSVEVRRNPLEEFFPSRGCFAERNQHTTLTNVFFFTDLEILLGKSDWGKYGWFPWARTKGRGRVPSTRWSRIDGRRSRDALASGSHVSPCARAKHLLPHTLPHPRTQITFTARPCPGLHAKQQPLTGSIPELLHLPASFHVKLHLPNGNSH